MSSKNNNSKESLKKLKNLKSALVPVFSNEGVSGLVEEVLRENEDIRLEVMKNPFYREALNEKANTLIKKYKGVVYWGKIIDKWDRVTSSLGLACELVPGAGNVVSALEEVAESIPKSIYSVYYVKKTGDWKALPLWAGAELASFIPYVGDLVDWSNIYINRARKRTKYLIKKEFKKMLSKNYKGDSLEKKVA